MESFGPHGPALPPTWRGYRDAFAVLQHLCNLTGGEPGPGIAWARLIAELGLSDRQGDELLSYLQGVGCVEYRQGQRKVALTERALEYMNDRCGRRRSLRPAYP